MENVVGARHEFHDDQYASEWADRFVPTPERLQLFDAIIDRIVEASLPSRHIVELDIGPGYLAARLLEAIPGVTYEGVDFSHSMLELAAARLGSHDSRVQFAQADLTTEDWGKGFHVPSAPLFQPGLCTISGARKTPGISISPVAGSFRKAECC